MGDALASAEPFDALCLHLLLALRAAFRRAAAASNASTKS
jgi:hypothetical protein